MATFTERKHPRDKKGRFKKKGLGGKSLVPKITSGTKRTAPDVFIPNKKSGAAKAQTAKKARAAKLRKPKRTRRRR
jgi:hypothetical protein